MKCLLGAVISGLLFILLGCKSAENDEARSEKSWLWNSIAFDVEISVECPHLDEGSQERVAAKLSKRTEEVERLFSLYISDSSLSTLNASGVLDDAPSELIELIRQCVQIGDETQGLFDVTVQPLWEYYHNKVSEVETEEEREAILGYVLDKVNYKNITLDTAARRVSFRKEGMKITLNGIIQGYLTDQLIEVLKEEGVTSALVNAGEYRALGINGSGKPWSVDIVSRQLDSPLASILIADGGALAVSSGAGHTFDIGGKNHHLFHPKNAESQPANRTIIVTADSATYADVLATVFAVSPEEDWESLLSLIKGRSLRVVRIYQNERLIWQSSK